MRSVRIERIFGRVAGRWVVRDLWVVVEVLEMAVLLTELVQ